MDFKNINMNKIIITALVLGTFTIVSSFSINKNFQFDYSSSKNELKYCDGWKDGYCEGWKDVKGKFAICPITPICPIPEIGKDTYKDGYNRGFKTGLKDASK